MIPDFIFLEVVFLAYSPMCVGAAAFLQALFANVNSLKNLPDPHNLPSLFFHNIQLYENEAEEKKTCIVTSLPTSHPHAPSPWGEGACISLYIFIPPSAVVLFSTDSLFGSP